MPSAPALNFTRPSVPSRSPDRARDHASPRYTVFALMGLMVIHLVIRRLSCGLSVEQKKMAKLFDELKAKKQL